jgi:hypothetical protein
MSPALGGAVTIEAVPDPDGTAHLMSLDASGTVATYTFSAAHGFVPVAGGAPNAQLPAPVTTPVYGDFLGTGGQLLVTGADGQTWIVSLAHPDQPDQGADFLSPAPAAPPAGPAAQLHLRQSTD